MDMQSLATRLDRLEAMEAIRALKARYAALADAKYTRDYQRQPDAEMDRLAWEQALCFSADAVWEGGAEFGASLQGHAQLQQWFQRSPWCFAVHYYGSPTLAVHDNRASGQWRLWQLALRADTREAVLLAAVTHEEYVRGEDGTWRCSFMRFDQTHLLPVGDGPDPLAATFAALNVRQT